MIWEFHGYSGMTAIRDGKWKAVRRRVHSKTPGEWELYDLDTDRSETTDLASRHPEIVRRLEAALVETRTVEPDFPCRVRPADRLSMQKTDPGVGTPEPVL